MTHIRDIFDSVSLSVIQFLESHKGVTNVQFFEIGGTSQEDIAEWEKNNRPFVLPEDFKHFLRISDGLLLRWNIKLNNEAIPLGNMHLNSLETIKRVKTKGQFLPPKPFSSLGSTTSTTDNRVYDFTAFALDSASDGNICFVFKNQQKESPQIWFQDLACNWHYMSEGFTEYFRLMIVHMGLPHWQYAFTDVGLDPITKVWFQFLSPERLAIDMKYHKKMLRWKEKQAQVSGTALSGGALRKKKESEQDDAASADDFLSTDEEETDEEGDTDNTWNYKPQKFNLKKVNQIVSKHQSSSGGTGGSSSQSSSARESSSKKSTKRSTSSSSLSKRLRSGKLK